NTIRAIVGDNEFIAGGAKLMGGGNQGPNQGVPNPNIAAQGSFLLGPPTPVAKGFVDPFVSKTNKPAVPAPPPATRPPSRSYNPPFVANPPPPDERTTGVNVMLRRLANPHLPFNAVASIPDPNNANKLITNPYYNPYVTVDALDKIALRDPNN